MSQIVDDLRQVAIEIKTETQVGGNTAARVGGAFERVADALEGTQQIEDMDEAVAAVQQAAQENEQTIQDIVNNLAVVQTTGQSASDVMSQKAVTDVTLLEETLSIGNPLSLMIVDSLKWDVNANTHYIIAVEQGVKYKVTASASRKTQYAWLKNNNTPVRNTNAPISDIDHAKHDITANTSEIITPPVDSNYLYFLGLVINTNYAPSKVEKLIPVNEAVEELKGQINIIKEGSLVNASDGVVLMDNSFIPAGSTIEYDFDVTGTGSTALACYFIVYKSDGTLEAIGKVSSASGVLHYGGSYVLPSNYTCVVVEGNSAGSMTINKLYARKLIVDGLSDISSLKNAALDGGVLVSQPKRFADGDVIFTSDNYKSGDTVHIDLTAYDTYSGYVEFYNSDNTMISAFGKISSVNTTVNDWEGDVLLPDGFAYAKINAAKTVNNVRASHYLLINSLYRVPNEWGVYKIGNPMFETLDTYNTGHSENQITIENVFGTSQGSNPIKRIPALIITNSGTVIAACEDRAGVGDNTQMGIILARKASGDSSWTYNNRFPYDANTYGKLMNPCFVVDRNGSHGTIGRIYLFVLSLEITTSNGGYGGNAKTEEIAEMYSYSDDDGVTWSNLAEINKELWDLSSYKFMINSPANGIITQNGTIVIPCMGKDNSNNWISGVLYKIVGGEWTFSEPSLIYGDNESLVFEGVVNNEIYLNCRNELFRNIRPLYKLNTSDGTLDMVYNGFIPNIKIQCSIDKSTISGNKCYLMTFPDPTAADQRNRITVWASADGIRWTRVLRITGNTISAGYAMISCYNGKCAMVYENDGWNCRTIGFADLTPALELLRQSSLMCGESADERIHRVTCYEKGISV